MSVPRVLRRPAASSRAVAALANATRGVVDAAAGLAVPAVSLPVLPSVLGADAGRGAGPTRRGVPVSFWEGGQAAVVAAASLAAAPPTPKGRRRKAPSVPGGASVPPRASAAGGMAPARSAAAVSGGASPRVGALRDGPLLEQLAAGDVDFALHVVRTPQLAGRLIDSDGQRLAHQAVSLVPAAALAVFSVPHIATMADHRGQTVAHTAVSFHEVAALTAMGRGGPMLRLADGTGLTVAHAAVLHRACAHLVIGMPVVAALRDAAGWTVLHEAVMQHPSVAALALSSPLALMTDTPGRTVAQTAVAKHALAALAVQQEAGIHPSVAALTVGPRRVSLQEFAYVVHPFAHESVTQQTPGRLA